MYKSTWLENKEKARKEKMDKFLEVSSCIVLSLMFAGLLIAMYNYSQYTLSISLQ